MKKAFIGTLAFYLVFHILAPYVFQMIFGFRQYYGKPFDAGAINLVVLINTIAVVISGVLIAVFPKPEHMLTIKVQGAPVLYGSSLLLSLLVFVIFGGFEGILAGQANNSMLAYIGMFLESSVLLFVVLSTSQNKIGIVLSVLAYIAIKTLGGSRSAVVVILLIVIMLLATREIKKIVKPFITVVLIGVVITPILFFAATFQRNGYLESDKIAYFMEIAVRRISYIETAAIPVYNQAAKDPAIEIFYRKYGWENQAKQIINTIVPGNVFSVDVDPKQYYRAAFMGYAEEAARTYYTSMNMTLPVFFYLFGGVFWAVAGTILVVLAFFGVAWVASAKAPLISIIFLFSLYGLLSFFDFVTVARQMVYVGCTLFTLYLFSRILGLVRSKFRTRINQ